MIGCEIPLTKGYVAIVSPEDFEAVNQFRWFMGSKTNPYAHRCLRTNATKSGRTTQAMHLFIAERMGIADAECIDHSNRDRLDNRRSNLRRATRSSNGANQAPRRDRVFKGITFSRLVKKWRAQIRVEGDMYQLGCFTCPIAAANAYDAAALQCHGEYAYTNFPIPAEGEW